MQTIFVSFRRSDSTAIAGRIYERLVKKFDLPERKQVSNDVGKIPPNVQPSHYVSELMQEYSVLLLVIGPHWATSAYPDGTLRLNDENDVVRLEIEAARKLDRPVVVACVSGASMPTTEQLPDSIQYIVDIKPIVFDGQDTFRRDINALLREITRVLAPRQVQTPDARSNGLDPDVTRQAILRTIARGNYANDKSPLAGVRLNTLGEVNWFVQGRAAEPPGLPKSVLKDLSGVVLSHTNLSNGILDGVNLSGADLTGTILIGASLKDAHLNNANLAGADLTGIHGEAADLTGANLSTATLVDAKLAGAKLNAAVLTNATMDGVDLQGAALQDADLSDARLSRALLTGAFLERTKLNTAVLDRARLDKATLDYANLDQASLRGADLSGASAVHVQLTQTILARANLREADLTDAGFGETDLSAANLTGTKLDAADDILKKLKFGLDVSLDQVAWSGIQVQPITKGMSRSDKVARYRDIARVNQRMAMVLRGLGLQSEAAKYRLKEQNTLRKILFLQHKYGAWSFSWLLNLTAGYGERLSRTVLSYLVINAAFAAVYFGMAQASIGPIAHLTWYDAAMLSIHSFHGRGLIPSAWNLTDPVALVSMLEAIVGLFIELVFIAMFGRRFLGS